MHYWVSVLEASWKRKWRILGHLEEHPEGILGHPGGILDRFGGTLERLGAILGHFGSILRHLEEFWVPKGPHLGTILGVLGP